MDLSLSSLLPNTFPQPGQNNHSMVPEIDKSLSKNQNPNPFPNIGEDLSFSKESGKKEEKLVKELTDENNKEFQSKVPSKWEWLPCNYELKKEADGIETHWSLSPTIQLAGADSKVNPQMDIAISLDRNFMHSEDLGWNWHKSWNLPNVTVSIKITDPKTNESILPPAELKAQLLAVKVLLNKSEQFKLYDLGLKGPYTQDLSEGQAVFSGIKFSSTSYNNDGVKFHLIVLIYIQDDARSRACPKILYSKISPPIFVDSRKSARDSNVTKKVVHKYFDPFPIETFEKTFIKRNSKMNESKEELIENSLEGLSQYFTAPNIRNKVKHPIFLASKFSKCVKLYYNSALIKFSEGNIKEEELIEKMQKIFIEFHNKPKSKSDHANKAFDNKYFILLIEEPNNVDSFHLNKKISDYLDPIINDVLHIIFNSNIAPPHFKEVPHERLAKAYIKVYSSLISIRNSAADDDDSPELKPKKSAGSKMKNAASISEGVNKKRDRGELSDDEDDEEEDMPKIEPEEQIVQKKVKAPEPTKKASLPSHLPAMQQCTYKAAPKSIDKDIIQKEEPKELSSSQFEQLKLLMASSGGNQFLQNLGGGMKVQNPMGIENLSQLLPKEQPFNQNPMGLGNLVRQNPQTQLFSQQQIMQQQNMLQQQPSHLSQQQQKQNELGDFLANFQQEQQLKTQLTNLLVRQQQQQQQSNVGLGNLVNTVNFIQQQQQQAQINPNIFRGGQPSDNNIMRMMNFPQQQPQMQSNQLNSANSLINQMNTLGLNNMMNRQVLPNQGLPNMMPNVGQMNNSMLNNVQINPSNQMNINQMGQMGGMSNPGNAVENFLRLFNTQNQRPN